MSTVINDDLGNRGTTTQPFPLDGTAFATDQYLQALSAQSPSFYRVYDKFLQYETALYSVKGNEDIERIWPIIMRTVVEFGKAGIAKVGDKFVPLSVIEVKHNIDYTVKKLTATVGRIGYGMNEKPKTWNFTPDKASLLKYNFNALPFIFYWKETIENMELLRQAALTASITSIKKIKKNVMNNSSEIARLEAKAMHDPRTPVVEVISNPSSYASEVDAGKHGHKSNNDITKSTTPNSITFESTSNDATGQWENLKQFMEHEFFVNGRRINTNKKNERNIAREIDTETINFDILESDFERYIVMFIRELNTKFGVNLQLMKVVSEPAEGEDKDKKPKEDEND